MSYVKRPLAAADVAFDETTLAVLVAQEKAAGTLTWSSKMVTTAGTAEPLTATSTAARKVFFRAAQDGGDNAGDVFLGGLTVDKDTRQRMKLEPGDYWQLPMAPGDTVDLATVGLDADNAADGVQFGYLAA